MSSLTIQIFDHVERRQCQATPFTGTLELGRQLTEDGKPVGPIFKMFLTKEGTARINLAPASDVVLSRQLLLLEPLPDGNVRVTNHANSRLRPLVDQVELPPGDSHTVSSNAVISLLKRRFEIRINPEESKLQSLAEPTLAPGRHWSKHPAVAFDNSETFEPEALVKWFQGITSVLESATSSEEFFERATQAMVDLLKLDAGRVLLFDTNGWRTVSAATNDSDRAPSRLSKPSERVLSMMRDEKKTFWEVPTDLKTESLANVEAVVAAPILDRQENVIGALYGDRRGRAAKEPCSINRLEAMLVRMLACGVAAGLARVEEQKAAIAERVRFEQFFTADLSRHLAAEPDLLSGRDAIVTVLFCDIRGFSRISSKLQSAAALVEWLSDVMSVLSDCVVAEEGVLVDYIGDELMAMWGAPAIQPEHAARACRAAQQMMIQVRRMSAEWETKLGESFDVGIGINSGPAFVGNTGSKRKFKYGPLGTTVNMASRVQGTTKHLGSPIIITAATRAGLGDEFLTRRLRQVRVVNIADAVELFELGCEPDEAWKSIRQQYEAALDAFEHGNLGHSVGILGKLLEASPGDVAARILLKHASETFASPGKTPEAVWELPMK